MVVGDNLQYERNRMFDLPFRTWARMWTCERCTAPLVVRNRASGPKGIHRTTTPVPPAPTDSLQGHCPWFPHPTPTGMYRNCEIYTQVNVWMYTCVKVRLHKGRFHKACSLHAKINFLKFKYFSLKVNPQIWVFCPVPHTPGLRRIRGSYICLSVWCYHCPRGISSTHLHPFVVYEIQIWYMSIARRLVQILD